MYYIFSQFLRAVGNRHGSVMLLQFLCHINSMPAILSTVVCWELKRESIHLLPCSCTEMTLSGERPLRLVLWCVCACSVRDWGEGVGWIEGWGNMGTDTAGQSIAGSQVNVKGQYELVKNFNAAAATLIYEPKITRRAQWLYSRTCPPIIWYKRRPTY